MKFAFARPSLTALQCGIAIIGLGYLTLRAPDSGRMLLIPIDARDEALALNIALDHGGLLVGRGPIRGSIVVEARRRDLSQDARSSAIVMMASPVAGCGSASPVDARA